MNLSVVFLGTAASAPTARRGLASLLVRHGGQQLLFDCGEGTQRQLVKSVGLPDLEHIFISHFHADHFLGLPGMFKTFGLRGRELPLTVYGPPGLTRLMADIEPLYGRLPYELTIYEMEDGERLGFGDFSLSSFRVDHAAGAVGFVLEEPDRPGTFDIETAKSLGVQPGPDFGILQRGGEVTVAGGSVVRSEQVLGEARDGRTIVYTGDTAPCDATREAAEGADLLIHEASFGDEEQDRAAETRHSTARQAAEVARDADVKLLCLTHVSGRYFGRELRDQAREVFPNTEMPRDFDVVELPFPERGEPHLLKDKD